MKTKLTVIHETIQIFKDNILLYCYYEEGKKAIFEIRVNHHYPATMLQKMIGSLSGTTVEKTYLLIYTEEAYDLRIETHI
jgi:hypothetical protein